jgi:O-antigen ligase
LFSRKIERNGEEGASSGFQRNLLLVASGLAIVLMLIGSAIFFGGESNVTRGLGLNAQTDISSGRLHYWQVAWQIFLHNPILGTGLDSFSLSYPLFDTWNGQQRVEQAHNDYLQILADAGILGFICVAAFIFFLYKKGLQTINNTDDRFRRGTAIGALGGIFGILVHSFFDFPLRTPSNAFFFLTLATLATATAIVMPAKHHRKRVRKTASRSVEEAA